MRILLVEDDTQIASFIQKRLREACYVVDHVEDGLRGLDYALGTDYAVAIIDLMLPVMDGLSLIQHMRSLNLKIPVLILSARSSLDDRVRGLQGGGDDYLVKPFAFAELLARIQALIRRSQALEEPTRFQVGDLCLDLTRRKVQRDQQCIELQPREFELLVYLMQNAGRVVSKTMIMENVWDYNFDPQTNIVESRICRLRDKIDRPFASPCIHTVRGVGYKLEWCA
ncbi:winged helix-turn-helix domain-containing protein [Planctomycetota bacterium]